MKIELHELDTNIQTQVSCPTLAKRSVNVR